jgi:hypothetical protein
MIDAADLRDIIASQLKRDPTRIHMGNKLYRIVMDGMEERRRLVVEVTVDGWFGTCVLELRDLEVKLFQTFGDGSYTGHLKDWVNALD